MSTKLPRFAIAGLTLITTAAAPITAAVGVGLAVTAAAAPVRAAQDAPEGVEKATTSSVVPIILPGGAHRSTSREDVAKFADVLRTIAETNEGRVSSVEVLLWSGVEDSPRGMLPEALKKAGYNYAAQPTAKVDGLGSVTAFVSVHAEKKGLLGFWVEEGETTLLAWGVFTADKNGKPTPTVDTPKKSDDDAPARKPVATAAKGGIPADLLGAWSWTTISGVNYQNTTTGQLAAPSGMSSKFTFTKDGRYKFFFYVRQRTYSLVTESTTTAEGTVTFGGDSTFTVRPEKGHYKGSTGSRIIDRPMTAEERKPVVWYWEWRTEDGKRKLYIGPGKSSMSLFKRADD